MEPLVATSLGKIKGVEKTSKLQDKYLAFYGIPYAKPPVGELRFKAPVPVEPWEGVLEATNEKFNEPYSYTQNFKEAYENEDCLNLNVFTRNLEKTKKPVFVYIYGGVFVSGSSAINMYGPDFLMTKDVILVTLNFRNGVFGFISFKDPALDVPGNAGLKDQRLALKWVKANIEAFGGDPDNITFGGHSSGGISVHAHCLSPSSAGLFKRALIMGGSALQALDAVKCDDNIGERVAKNLGYTGDGSDKDVYEFLKTQDAAELYKAARPELLSVAGERVAFGPIVEAYESESVVCREMPIHAARASWSSEIEIIFIFNSNEGLIMNPLLEPALKYGINEAFLVPVSLLARLSPTEKAEALAKIKAVYGNFEGFGPGNTQSLTDAFSDQIIHGIHRSILSRLHYASGKTYLMYFDLASDTLNHLKIKYKGIGQKGACHGDELSYIFCRELGPMVEMDSIEFRNIQKMADLMESILRQGSFASKNVTWEPIEKQDLPYSYKGLRIQDPEWTFGEIEAVKRLPIRDSLYQENELY